MEDTYKTIFNASPVCIGLISSDGQIEQTNPRWDNTFKNIRNFFDILQADDRKSMVTHAKQIFEKKKDTYARDNHIADLNGQAHWFFTIMSGIDTHTFGRKLMIVQRDITHHKMIEQALEQSETKCSQMFRECPYGILIVDAENHEIFKANHTFCGMTGYTVDELTQMTIKNLHPAEDLYHIISEFNAQLNREKTLCRNIPFVCKDGTRLITDINSSPIVMNNRTYLAGFIMDAAERKKLENEKSKRAKLEAIIEMAGAVCHDLNQPLQVLSGQVEILQALAGDNRKLLAKAEKMAAQIDSMAQITRKLNNLTNYEVVDYLEGQKILDLNRSSEMAAIQSES